MLAQDRAETSRRLINIFFKYVGCDWRYFRSSWLIHQRVCSIESLEDSAPNDNQHSLRRLFFYTHFTVNWSNAAISGCYSVEACSCVSSGHTAQSRVQLWSSTKAYTHHEYCVMLLTAPTSKSEAGIFARKYTHRYPARRHPDANVLRWLQLRLRGTVSIAITALLKWRLP
jgi:hypothetical protein